MSPRQAARHARKDRVLRYDRYLGSAAQPQLMDSFMLKDGRYACAGDATAGNPCYTIYEGVSADVISALDENDHDWLLSERKKTERESFLSINGCMGEEENEAFSRQGYQRWLAREAAANANPVHDPRLEIIRLFMESLKEDDRKLLLLTFDNSFTTQEIMMELGIKTKQALTNRKTRLLDKLRQVFALLGYEVPTPEELSAERQRGRE